MKKKHDLTACLPFPDPRPATREAHHARRSDRAPLELAQLELADLRVHGSPLWRTQGISFANDLVQGGSIRVQGGSIRGGAAALFPGRSTDRSSAVAPSARVASDLPSARAVRQGDQGSFYLDLVGAVLIMALVVLAAILV